jgi:hypothetical protein
MLGIEQNSESIILEELDSQLYYSSNGQQIIPHPLVEDIAKELKSRALQVAVDLHAFSRKQDIRFDSLQRMIENYTGSDWPRVIIDVDKKSFLCTYEYTENIKSRIDQAISCASNELCNLSSVVENEAPPQIIVALATEAAAGKGGNVRFAGDHVVYAPPGYNDAAADQVERLRSERIADLVDQLTNEGFCEIRASTSEFISEPGGDATLDEVVINRFQKANPHSVEVSSIDITPDTDKTSRRNTSPHEIIKVLVRSDTLREEIDSMKLAVGTRAGILWSTGASSAVPANVVRNLQETDFEAAHKPALTKLLSRSHFVKELEATASNCLSELESQRHEQFVDLVEERLWCPLHCYSAGIMTIQDPTLKQHLEDFLMLHFKSDIVPRVITAAKEDGFLNDRARKKETDKLQKFMDEAKCWDDVQKCVAKSGKKLQIPPPTEELVLKVKYRAIGQTVKAMQRMTRGSDVLQNLIWVLLATSGPGLFLSPGKDTTRMIKHYDSIADPEVAGMLAIWRDKLKSGTQDEEDIRQMKELAKGAVEDWMEEEKQRPYAGT